MSSYFFEPGTSDVETRGKRYLLVSTSKIKQEALIQVLGDDDDFTLKCISVDPQSPAGQWNAEQPVGNNGLVCAKLRITSVPRETIEDFDFVVSIENSIQRIDEDVCEDVVNVIIYDVKRYLYTASIGGNTPFPTKYWDIASRCGVASGFSTTIGELMAKDSDCPATDPKNWMKDVAKVDRTTQIIGVLETCFSKAKEGKLSAIAIAIAGDVASLRANVHYVPHHPKYGVLFQDIGPLLRHTSALVDRLTAECIMHDVGPLDVTAIVGLDARGFVIGGMLAGRWGRPFIMARKPPKLPEPKVSVDYGLEYGENTLEMSVNSFKPGDKVLVVDDLVATGGSLVATIELMKKTKHPPHLLGCLTVLSVEKFLSGEKLLDQAREKLKKAGCPKLITLL